ncbi:sigma-70 family RNA polymerase sigma factor [Salinibacterium sp. NSLL150]|uniref:sigma-70 family RNA polymerase sigma factor n=1 Tax=unclassified Salinibacterium TaxID=2632331 RepID=UPI0018CCD0A6|nr:MULTISPECIES: sigma-70 family RNA polymerase sigma factor [unclassified Salinibacterium]MBH0099762.1 sigma-70 family RNA polymerase sigma factor [Salinibacterium sp. NSLL35]MBH0102516.1 sigma-70 family RNA polymerase sigma factor [Salinibacterium sp. NSLL150]MBH0105276.1 sigma-70 family RNA polymerase sigma factor [Salinibacterium sp. NSLL16]MBH0108036.1 sigma-70 family RNA polymerase sigma factor [Salinibacterium sp. NSLL17]
MSGIVAPKLTTSDEQLLAQARTGVQNAFAELWSRHYRSGICVARQYTSIDADDLVSESFARIYQRVLAGGGPQGAFRPYLYTTIRNLASTWGAASREVQVDEIADFEDPKTLDDPIAVALDHSLTAKAFRELPERWQSVLWYTEVEGMDPHEVAPLLGMSPNGVAALSYRAREGLRKAWLQAHINDATASGECQWAMSKFGEHARKSLSGRDTTRIEAHLASCTRCAIVCEEVDEVGSRLALVMIPMLLGGVAGGGFLSAFGQGGAASLTAAAAPAMPAAVVASTHLAGAGSAVAVGGASAGALPVAVAGTLAAAVALTGSLVVLGPTAPDSTSAEGTTTSDTSPGQNNADVTNSGVSDNLGGSRTDPSDITIPTVPSIDAATDTDGIASGTGGLVGSVGDAVGGLVDSVVGTVTGGAAPEGHTAPGGVVGADVNLNLVGTATPGAHLSLQAAGLVYATTTVSSDGTFALNVTGIPGGLSSLDLVQTVDRGYLGGLVGTGGLLGGLLGTVDGLINDLIKPLQLSSGNNQGINVRLLS